MAGVIEPPTSGWASPVLTVPKKDRSFRFYINYHHLNNVTGKDTYPLPQIITCIDSLGTANIFSTLDANSGDWKIQVEKEDRDKKTFVSHAALYRHKHGPIGLTNALATFQRALDVIVSGFK